MEHTKFKQRVMERFFSKVEKTGNCWNWIGCLGQDGYGKFTIRRKTIRAHRYSYEIAVGEIPSGLVLDHLCKNTKCVNPAHLEAVTQRENLMRSPTFQALNAAKKVCPRGHPYEGSNLFIRPDGARACRECSRLWKENRRRQEGRKIRGPYCESRKNIAFVTRNGSEWKWERVMA